MVDLVELRAGGSICDGSGQEVFGFGDWASICALGSGCDERIPEVLGFQVIGFADGLKNGLAGGLIDFFCFFLND